MKQRCVIVAGGNCNNLPKFNSNDFVIAADSGLYALQEKGIVPDLLVGDFDSYLGELPLGVETIRLPVIKDETDLLYAAKQGVERGFNYFLILGGYGSRPDQNFAMYDTLYWIKKNCSGANVLSLCDGFSVTMLSDETAELSVLNDEYFSVFSFGGKAENVSINGADYNLNNHKLISGFPLGVSNCVTGGGKVLVTVNDGTLLVFIVKKSI